jgi:hypothetical protein
LLPSGFPDRVLTAAECFDAGVRAAQAIDVNAYLRDGEHERIYELLWRTEHSVAWLVSWWEPLLRDRGRRADPHAGIARRGEP